MGCAFGQPQIPREFTDGKPSFGFRQYLEYSEGAFQPGTEWVFKEGWEKLKFSSPQFLLICFLSVLGSAFYNTYSKKLLDRYSALRVVLYSYCSAFVLMLPITLYMEPQSFRNLLHFSLPVWLGLIFLALLRNFLALVIFLSVLSRLEATVVGLSNYLIPFFGVVTAAIFLHERLTKFMLLGGVLVLASTLLVTVYERRQRRGG
jgi:drug/metabolite transporter (DMT)-like permease